MKLSTSTFSLSRSPKHAVLHSSSHASGGACRLQARGHAGGTPAGPHARRRSQTYRRRPPRDRRGQAAIRERSVVPRRRQGALPARGRRSLGQARRHAGDARHPGLSEPPALSGSGRQFCRGGTRQRAGNGGAPSQAFEGRLDAEGDLRHRAAEPAGRRGAAQSCQGQSRPHPAISSITPRSRPISTA